MLVSRTRGKPVDGKKQRMVSVTFKTVGDGRDVYQIVWLYNDKTWYNLLSCNSTVKEVQLHPFAQ